MLNWIEMVEAVRDEVRGGTAQEQAIAEVAADYEADPQVLVIRVKKAFPDGIPGPLPSLAEMERRRREEIRIHNERVEAENEAVAEYFRENPDVLLEVRKMIRPMTGRSSISYRGAKRLAEKLGF